MGSEGATVSFPRARRVLGSPLQVYTRRRDVEDRRARWLVIAPVTYGQRRVIGVVLHLGPWSVGLFWL